jgi:hypothetical protein
VLTCRLGPVLQPHRAHGVHDFEGYMRIHRVPVVHLHVAGAALHYALQDMGQQGCVQVLYRCFPGAVLVVMTNTPQDC